MKQNEWSYTLKADKALEEKIYVIRNAKKLKNIKETLISLIENEYEVVYNALHTEKD